MPLHIAISINRVLYFFSFRSMRTSVDSLFFTRLLTFTRLKVYIFLDKTQFSINPLHPIISLSILQTVRSTFRIRSLRGFDEQSRASLVCDHFLYSRDLYVRFSGDVVRRN